MPNRPKIFISYSHRDNQVVRKLESSLSREGFEVVIDHRNMQPGGDIFEFIEDSIRNTHVTISVVSESSLQSTWVCTETIQAFQWEMNMPIRFIGCYIDQSVFDVEFVTRASMNNREKIQQLQSEIQRRHDQNMGAQDLYPELQRRRDLDHNLPEIISRLKQSYCIDLSDQFFDIGFKRLSKALQNQIFHSAAIPTDIHTTIHKLRNHFNERPEKIVLNTLSNHKPRDIDRIMQTTGFNRRKVGRVLSRLKDKNLAEVIDSFWFRSTPDQTSSSTSPE